MTLIDIKNSAGNDPQPPLFILGAPRSFTSLICGMLGQNPGAFGAPELNLFLTDSVKSFITELAGSARQIQIHGVLRMLAHLISGEQTLDSIDMARRWLILRQDWTTTDVFQQICQFVAPLRVVDKSPVYTVKPEYLARIHAAFPDAHYLHLVRHPRTQGESIMNIAQGMMVVLANSIDYKEDPPVIDPQIMWYDIQKNVYEFLENIPADRQMRLRGELVLESPERWLPEICEWCGLPADAEALEFMLHPEDSPFASIGPLGAHFGNDPNFLRSPGYRAQKMRTTSLDGPLSWREDGKGFNSDVLTMAKEIGYV